VNDSLTHEGFSGCFFSTVNKSPTAMITELNHKYI